MATHVHPYGLWDPWLPEDVAHSFSPAKVPWWIAGGWAIDLFLGKQAREHEDIDVQILRRDQLDVRALFQGWDIQGALPGGPDAWPFWEWEPGTLLPPSIHDVWCRPSRTDPWVLQLMIGDVADDQWLFRRDACLRRSLATIGHRTPTDIPYLAPEIQLLYKAKTPRPKDEADFARTLPYLDHERRQWLAQSLAIVHPGHIWLTELA